MGGGRQNLITALSACGSVLIAVAGLLVASRADQQGARVAALKASAKEAVALRAIPSLPPPRSTLCRTSREVAIVEVAAALRTAGAASGVRVERLEFARLERSLPAAMSGAQVYLTASGGEVAFTRFLRATSEAHLPVFLDSVDIMRTGAGGLQAQFSGRVLCQQART